MPIERARIDQALLRWMASLRRPSGSALKTKRTVTNALLRAAAADGVLYVRDLRRHHFDATLADLADGIGQAELKRRAELVAKIPSLLQRRRVETYALGGPRSGRSEKTLVGDRRHLRQFVEYCQANRWLATSFQPFPPEGGPVVGGDAAGTEDAPEKRRIVRFNDWPRLLDTAEQIHPRIRIMIAMGLYWGRRVSEVSAIQWGHVNLTDEFQDRSGLSLSYRALEIQPGHALIRNVKRRRTITIPIGVHMREELERWRVWAEKRSQMAFEPLHYIIPARVPSTKLHTVGGSLWVAHDWPIVMANQASTVSLNRDVHLALTAFGWREIKGEGMRTFRRSVAAHLDSIGEIAAAQALLDHMNRSTTEGYSGNRAGEADLSDLMARDNPFERHHR